MALQTTSNSSAILTLDYERIVRDDLNMRSPLLAAFERAGTDKPTRAKQHVFGLLTQGMHNFRIYQSDPSSFLPGDSNLQSPMRKASTVDYKKIYGPYRVSWEVMQEATTAGALTNVLEDDLDIMVESYKNLLERELISGKADAGSTTGWANPLFMSSAADDGAAGVTIDSLYGQDGEEIGIILELLNLPGAKLSWQDDPYTSTVRDTGVATVSTVTSTLGSEKLVFTATADVDDVADNDYCFFSKSTTAYVKGDGLMGLTGMCANWSEAGLDNLQGLTSTTAPNFAAHVLSNGGTKRDLDETLLQKAITIARLRQPGRNSEGVSLLKHAFVCNDIQRDQFANTASVDRRFTAPQMIGKMGVKPTFGVDFEATTFNGVPFICSQLMYRNRVFLVDFPNQYLVHNGPAEGQFLLDASPSQTHRASGTPQFEYVWTAFVNGATKRRAGNVTIKDLTTMSGI